MKQCPICYSDLETIDCAPCYDCGHLKEGLEHLNQELHKYNVYEFKGVRLTLCEVCDVDLGSYKEELLGFKLRYEDLNFIAEIEHPAIGKDKFCPECNKRLKFLEFINRFKDEA